MIDINILREYFDKDAVFVTEHAAERYRQREIKTVDVRMAVKSGEIIEQYPNDYPFPSCLILGRDGKGRTLHVCMSDEGSCAGIITAYCPDMTSWNEDLKTRREDNSK